MRTATSVNGSGRHPAQIARAPIRPGPVSCQRRIQSVMSPNIGIDEEEHGHTRRRQRHHHIAHPYVHQQNNAVSTRLRTGRQSECRRSKKRVFSVKVHRFAPLPPLPLEAVRSSVAPSFVGDETESKQNGRHRESNFS